MTTKKPYIFILLSAMLWGTTGTAQSLLIGSFNPISIGALRMLIGGSALMAYALFTSSFKTKNKNSHDTKYWILSVICITLYQPFFFTGVAKTGVGLSTVITIASAPIFTGLIEFIINKKISKIWIVATFLSILGCILLFMDSNNSSINIIGVSCAFSAGLSYAVYVIATSNLIKNNSREKVNAITFFSAAIILFPLIFLTDFTIFTKLQNIFSLLHLGIIATAIAYTLFAKGLAKVDTPNAVTLSLAEPLTAMILSITILKEPITIKIIIGSLLIFIGLIINTKD